MLRLKHGFAVALAALTCPCHLPLLAALLAGTALGSYIATNLVSLVAVFGLLFAGSLWLAFRQPAAAPRGRPQVPLAPLVPAPAGGEQELPRVWILTTPGCASCAGVVRGWAALWPRYEGHMCVEMVDLLARPEVARRFGVLRTPAVVIDGQLRAQGSLNVAQLRRLLDEVLYQRAVAAEVGERRRA